MFKKMVIGAAVAAGVVAMAMPAGALTQTKTANFGGNGQVNLVEHLNSWHITTRATLPPGKYVLSFSSTQGGFTDSTVTADVCHFTMTAKDKVAGCSNSGKGPAPKWRFVSERPDTFVAQIDAVAANGTRTTALGPVTLG